MIAHLVSRAFPTLAEIEEIVEDALDDAEVDWHELTTEQKLKAASDPDRTAQLGLNGNQLAQLQEGLKYLSALMAGPVGDLKASYGKVLLEEAAAQRAAANEEAERLIHSLENDADFSYWASIPRWTAEEATALWLGKAPDRIPIEVVKQLPAESDFRQQYERMLFRIERAISVGELGERPIEPSNFLLWLKKDTFPCPPELEAGVVRRKDFVDPQAARIAELEQQLANEKLKSATDDDLNPKRRVTLLKIVYLLAFEKYPEVTDVERARVKNRISKDLAPARAITVNPEAAKEALKMAERTVLALQKKPGAY